MNCYSGEEVFSLGLGCLGSILGTDMHPILVDQCCKVSCTGDTAMILEMCSHLKERNIFNGFVNCC